MLGKEGGWLNAVKVVLGFLKLTCIEVFVKRRSCQKLAPAGQGSIHGIVHYYLLVAHAGFSRQTICKSPALLFNAPGRRKGF